MARKKTKLTSHKPEDTNRLTDMDELDDENVQPTEKEFLTPTEAMKYLGISAATLYKLMDNATLPFYTIKGIRKRRIKKEDLDALMEKGVPGSQDED